MRPWTAATILTLVSGSVVIADVLYSNCNISTGPMALNGAPAPTGFVWSEVARDETNPWSANTVAGFRGLAPFRLADDFVVPVGGFHVAYVKTYAYLTGATTPGVTAATLRILDASPLGTPNVVFGDQSTNRLASVGFSYIYRIFNTVVAPTCSITTPISMSRRLQEVYISVNQFLPAGVYWLDLGYTGAMFTPPSTQPDATGRQCNPANSNALQFNLTWQPVIDVGQGCVITAVPQDLYFELIGTPGGGCYANCDGSTGSPLLTANDFQCFNNAYAAGSTTANCDNSTGSPLLTANDFQCFINAYAAGCS